jgi:hypothetical protein
MIPMVITGYATLMLTIVFALMAATRRPEPKPSELEAEELQPVRRVKRPTSQPVPSRVRGGAEVLAFGA